MPLPAPYAPPWKRLGEDGVALVAWLGLKLREWTRRNREGTLPVPPFWPRRWPQLFWPVVVVGLLVSGLALARLWLAPPLARSPMAEEAEGIASPPSPVDAMLEGAALEGPEIEDSGQPPPPSKLPAESERAGTLESSQRPPTPTPTSPPSPSPSPTPESAQPTPEPAQAAADGASQADLLLAEWSAADPEAWIAAVRSEPATATLTLQLKSQVPGQPSAQRARQAEHWLERATALGYSHLQLVDGQGRLLGRDARVGGGMLMLQPWDPKTLPP